MSPQKMLKRNPHVPVFVTLFGDSVFANDQEALSA